jgi:hypothetical protein
MKVLHSIRLVFQDVETLEKQTVYSTVGKYPRLEELYDKLFNSSFPAHNSMEDVRALKKCFYELKKIGILKI